MVDVFIGIGGNIGDRESYISNAVSSLSNILIDLFCSGMYKTEPRDYYDQEFFVNVVVKGKTDLSPFDLLKYTQQIELGGGRNREKKIPKGPRTIDLDILLYGKKIIDSDLLKIPHPSMKERRFVLIPLLELDADLRDPITDVSYYSYLDKIEKQGVYCHSLNSYNNLFL